MSELKVHCNNGIRPLVCYLCLPKEVAEDFDYMASKDLDERVQARFVFYKGSWYDVYDCDPKVADEFAALGFGGQQSDSYFSGVIFKFFDTEGKYLEDEVIVGRYTC